MKKRYPIHLFYSLLLISVFPTGINAQANRVGVTYPTLEINLYASAVNGSMYLTDGILMNFNNSFSAGVDNMDVRKIMNASDNISVVNGIYKLIVERRPHLTTLDTIKLNLSHTRESAYRFEIDPSVLSYPGMNGFLQDKFLGTSIPLSFLNVTNYNFAINANPLSKAVDRFRIYFNRYSPIRFAGLSAIRNQDNTVNVTWNVENENDVNFYNVEQSKDGINFYPLFSQMPTSNNLGNASYFYKDIAATKNTLWYRIKSTAILGVSKFSDTVNVSAAEKKLNTGITVYPNPVVGGKIHLQFQNQQAGWYQVYITNKIGQLVHTEKIYVASNNVKSSIQLNNTTAGTYQLICVKDNISIANIAFVKL